MGIYETNQYIEVNGVKMLAKAYKKQKRAELGITPKKRKKVVTDIQLIDSDVKAMLRNVRLIKSLSAYYDNAYRQWGRIAKDIISYEPINMPFSSYRIKVKEMNKTLKDIEKISSKNEKAVFQYSKYIIEVPGTSSVILPSGAITMRSNSC